MYVRDRLYGSGIATLTTTRYARVREDAIMYAISAMQAAYPELTIRPEPLSTEEIECVRRLTTEEQRKARLALDRDEVEREIHAREQRLRAYLEQRRLRASAPSPQLRLI